MEKTYNKSIIIFTLIILIFRFLNYNELLKVIPLIILIISIKKPVLAVSLWIITNPLNLDGIIDIFHITRLFLITGLFINMLLEKKYKIKIETISFLLVYIIIMFLSIIINDLEQINDYIYLLTSLALFFFISMLSQNIKEENIKQHMIFSVIVSAIVTIVILIINKENSILFGRLSINQSIRNLSNNLGLSILFLWIYLINNNKLNNNHHSKSIIMFTILSLLTIFLILTDSRGVIFPLIISMLFYLLLNKDDIKISRVIHFLVLTIIIICYLLNNQNIFENYTLRNFDFDSNGRLLIWKLGINSFFENIDLSILFGKGLGGFSKNLINIHGLNIYAHSVFIDNIVSLGLSGFLLITIYLIILTVQSFKYKDKTVMSMLLFIFLTFATHGNTQHYLFWLYLSLSKLFLEIYKKEKT